MGWHARLALDWRHESRRTVARFEHEGPLRILQSLWPEGDVVCHNVLVHPPGGLVGGDTVEIAVTAGAGSHGLVTTPGAARFYRTEGAAAVQRTSIRIESGARVEWLPLETICFPGCVAENHLRIDLAPGAEAFGWDVTAFGLPHAAQPFESGRLTQHIEVAGSWLERATIDAADARLMDGPLGLAGHRCMGSLFFACGSDIPRERRDAALDAARTVIDRAGPGAIAGATAPGPRVIVVRVLAPMVEPAFQLLKAVRAAWRQSLWQLAPVQPRGWRL